jgi:hypothetical protein
MVASGGRGGEVLDSLLDLAGEEREALDLGERDGVDQVLAADDAHQSVEAAVALSACYGLSVLIGALPGAVVPLLPGER